jgi:NADP-dependent 3-hydroxy acid dehydrogenase YdfG
MHDTGSLHGQIAWVTGGGTGIGAGIAIALHRAGAQVVAVGRRLAPLQAMAQSVAAIESKGRSIDVHALDVGDRNAVTQLVTDLEAKHQRVDMLVHCAGMNIVNRRMEDMRPEQWDEMVQVNLTGAYNCMHAVLPAMRKRKSGLIVNISSVAGKRAIALAGVAYASTKFGLTALGTAIANECRNEGVRVTNVYPGEVNTPILDRRPVPVSDEHRAAILQPEDLAAMVVAIALLPPRAHVPEIVIKPTIQEWF